ncbi:MAG TPA: hypothetical protein PLX21_08965 [Rhodocyclaceae bacterium]|nr:hypothetical protein [Rhodocyclaceae bacterium]
MLAFDLLAFDLLAFDLFDFCDFLALPFPIKANVVNQISNARKSLELLKEFFLALTTLAVPSILHDKINDQALYLAERKLSRLANDNIHDNRRRRPKPICYMPASSLGRNAFNGKLIPFGIDEKSISPETAKIKVFLRHPG